MTATASSAFSPTSYGLGCRTDTGMFWKTDTGLAMAKALRVLPLWAWGEGGRGGLARDGARGLLVTWTGPEWATRTPSCPQSSQGAENSQVK